ncbi:MAG: TRAP transporter substrate-binding protein [Sporomusaceae bacterium]|nr:TRAP transporter substrate-binding protein [Sporomusaceae bacterium]
MKKVLLGATVLAIFMVTMVGCSSFSEKKTEYVLRLGYGQPTTSTRHVMAERFSTWIYEQSQGKIKIELFPGESLGTDKQMTEMAITGSLDLVITAPGVLASYEPKLAVLELPFLFSSRQSVATLLDGKIGEELAESLPQRGIRLLAYWDNGFRQFTNNKQPIERVEDFKGLKIRVPENAMTLAILRAYGASPVVMAFPEVYPALQRKEIDGQENPISTIYSNEFYKVQKYLTILDYKYEATPLIISEKTWRRLSPDLQNLLREGALRFAREQRQLNYAQETQNLQTMEALGMDIRRPSLVPFQKTSQGIYKQWESSLGKDFIDRILHEARK